LNDFALSGNAPAGVVIDCSGWVAYPDQHLLDWGEMADACRGAGFYSSGGDPSQRGWVGDHLGFEAHPRLVSGGRTDELIGHFP
jgi:hypothetical protein